MRKCILLFLLIFIDLYSNETVVFAIGDWEPYTSSRDENGKIAEKIVSEALKLENIDVEFEYFPWKRCGFYVRNGQYAGTFPWMRTETREEEYFFNTVPIITSKTVLFHLKSFVFDWNVADDLKEFRIGGTIGYATTEFLEEEGFILNLSRSDDLNYKNILLGINDLFPCSLYVGYYQINMLFETSEASLFTHHPRPVFEGEPMYMLLKKNDPDSVVLAEKLDRGLVKLKESGRYDEILSELFK